MFFHGHALHEFAHLIMCEYFNVYVESVQWSVFYGHEISYTAVRKESHVSWITYAPLLLSLPVGLVAIALSVIASSVYVELFLLWFGIGTVVTAVPSPLDGYQVLNAHSDTTLVTSITSLLIPCYWYWYRGVDLLGVIVLWVTFDSSVISYWL